MQKQWGVMSTAGSPSQNYRFISALGLSMLRIRPHPNIKTYCRFYNLQSGDAYLQLRCERCINDEAHHHIRRVKLFLFRWQMAYSVTIDALYLRVFEASYFRSSSRNS